VAGVLTSLIAGLFPALAAAGTRPVSLMHKSVSEYRFQRMIPGLFLLGLIILTAAGLLMRAGHDHAGYDFSGLFMIFFGAALLTPLIIRLLVRALLAAGSRVLGIMIKMALFLENEISVNPVINTIKQMIPPGSLIRLQPGADIKQSILAVFDNTFVITSALQVLTAIVALTGILNAVMALLLERTREIGILRACGTLPGQVRGLLIHECFFYGLLSGIMAIPLGIALSWILIHVINQRTFGWTYDMILSPGILVQALVLSSAAALAAGIFPALAAGRIRISEALHME
jgi:ABC-type lipoprotein release transport system permease subunit